MWLVSRTWCLNFVLKPRYQELRTWTVEEEPVEVAGLKNWIFRVQRVMVLPDKLLAGDTRVDLVRGVRRQACIGDPCLLLTQVSCPSSCLLFPSLSPVASPGMGLMVGIKTSSEDKPLSFSSTERKPWLWGGCVLLREMPCLTKHLVACKKHKNTKK